jgi:hypothetical protein
VVTSYFKTLCWLWPTEIKEKREFVMKVCV